MELGLRGREGSDDRVGLLRCQRHRVREEDAAFKGREVQVDSGVPPPPNHASLPAVEYHDVHAISQPELRKTFRSFSKLKAWLKEHASNSKG